MYFIKGGKGRVEECKIWGNAKAGVGIHGSVSEAILAGCKCAGDGLSASPSDWLCSKVVLHASIPP